MFSVSIEAGLGVRGLAFGSTREQTRSFFGARVMQAVNDYSTAADHWTGVTAQFTTDEILVALELGAPTRFDLNGRQLSGLDFQAAVELVRAFDPKTLTAPMAAHSGALCLTICAPPDPEGPISVVLDKAGSGEWWWWTD